MESLKDRALAFLRLASSGESRRAFELYAGADFRHHNAFFPSDAESLARAMEQNASQNPAKQFEPLRSLEDGSLVCVHSRMVTAPGARPVALVHLFRFDGDRIVELWDVAQPEPEVVLNERGMF